MSKRTLSTKSDIDFLVRTFYVKVRQHPILGSIFNEAIGEDWEEHLLKLIGFWEANLLSHQGTYSGNPPKVHVRLDKAMNNSIEQKHFGYWLELWVETLDSHFEGEKQVLAKERARKMAHMLFMHICKARAVDQ